MLYTYQVGDFIFDLEMPAGLPIPEDMKLFELPGVDGSEDMRLFELPEVKASAGVSPYHYRMTIVEALTYPSPEQAEEENLSCFAQREDLLVLTDADGREVRYIGIRGQREHYACCREAAEDMTEIFFVEAYLNHLPIMTIFASLLSLERRMIERDSLILHSAYLDHEGRAILFSAPSETGKSTQAGLWEKYRGSRTVNGDRSLLIKRGGIWTANGWPVCGSSEICHNETRTIRAIVMLSQASQNHCEHLSPGRAFALIYSQITINGWNPAHASHAMELIEDLITCVPVYHLACNISEDAVRCLEEALEGGGE